jgi:uncharacterized membrane protein YkvA (DUF1232 family)
VVRQGPGCVRPAFAGGQLRQAGVGYAFSPIDLIPDFIPVVGHLDDVVLVPLGILLVAKLIPAEVMAECRSSARERLSEDRPRNWIAGSLIAAVWVAAVVLFGWICFELATPYLG